MPGCGAMRSFVPGQHVVRGRAVVMSHGDSFPVHIPFASSLVLDDPVVQEIVQLSVITFDYGTASAGVLRGGRGGAELHQGCGEAARLAAGCERTDPAPRAGF